MIFFLGFFFFQSDRPIQYQGTHSTVNKKKKGDGLTNDVDICVLTETRLKDCDSVSVVALSGVPNKKNF